MKLSKKLEILCLYVGLGLVLLSVVWVYLDMAEIIKTMFVYKSKGFMYATCVLGGCGIALLPSIVRDVKDSFKRSKRA